MRVWVLTLHTEDDGSVLGVYTTSALAQDGAAAHLASHTQRHVKLMDWEAVDIGPGEVDYWALGHDTGDYMIEMHILQDTIEIHGA